MAKETGATIEQAVVTPTQASDSFVATRKLTVIERVLAGTVATFTGAFTGLLSGVMGFNLVGIAEVTVVAAGAKLGAIAGIPGGVVGIAAGAAIGAVVGGVIGGVSAYRSVARSVA